MNRIPVQSTNLASVGYEQETSTIEIEFVNGGIYQYYGVPVDIYEGLMAAGSKGTFFHQNIRTAGYSYAKVG